VAAGKQLRLNLRRQVLTQDRWGRNQWEMVITPKLVWAAETAIIICDMWDHHWSRGAAERCAEMAVRMNEVVEAARAHGARIIHSPSETMEFHAGTRGRQRMLEMPRVAPPEPLQHADPPLPIDDSDHGSDTGETSWHRAWSKQHPAIQIAEEDAISDSGEEIYSFLRHRGLTQLVIMGVHTNMCVLHRSFGIKQMVRWGVEIALARDLTDTMYNPAMRPYVSHDEGTRLVAEFIEKFWCPTLASEDLVRAC
jgi:nicotinamidase-related amidase